MNTFQKSISEISEVQNLQIGFEPDLILLFISPDFSDADKFVKILSEKNPSSIITGCSTCGEITDINVDDRSVALNAISFDKTEVRMTSANVVDYEDCEVLGKHLIKNLHSENLKHVLVFSEGMMMNGDDLARGMSGEAPAGVGITGGMAADGTNFERTFVVKNDQLSEGEVVAIGLYGSALKVGYNCKGGWNSFGIERKVTKSDKNVLYEIDGQPALQLYKSFLGEQAHDLPTSGLLFPLSLRVHEDSKPLVRACLGINEEDQSITFGGNMPEGSFVRLMKANVDRLISGAEDTAQVIMDSTEEDVEFALLVSCMGRRVVLKQLVEEEVEVIREVLGERAVISGFYSYGEIAPFITEEACQLHNQTMTITTFSEVV